MLKQGIKTINDEFVWTCALSQLSFVQFRPYATSFLKLLSLTLMSKGKNTLEMSLDLTSSFKTSADARVESLVSNVDYLKIGTIILFKRNTAEKDLCQAHKFCSLNCNFSFCMDFLHCWWLLKVKKNK